MAGRLEAVEQGVGPEAEAERQTASAASEDPLGVQVEPITAEFRDEYGLADDIAGVVITDSEQRGALARKVQMRVPLNGRIVQYPWVIRDLDGESIESVSDYERVVKNLKPGSVASLSIYDPVNGNSLFPSVRIPSR